MVRARVAIRWSRAALSDLDRFAAFLHETDPRLAATIAAAVAEKVNFVAEQPLLGRPIAGRFRQVVLQVARAPYVVQYRHERLQVTILRVYHGREGFERP